MSRTLTLWLRVVTWPALSATFGPRLSRGQVNAAIPCDNASFWHPADVWDLADDLCELVACAPADDEILQALTDKVKTRILGLRLHHDEMLLLHNAAKGPDVSAKTTSHRTAYLFKCFLLSGLLRSDDSLADTLLLAARTLLPVAVADMFADQMHDKSARPPHKSTISRKRLIVDVAHMLYMRQVFDDVLQQKCAIYIQIDSSPQGLYSFYYYYYCYYYLLLLSPLLFFMVLFLSPLSLLSPRRPALRADCAFVRRCRSFAISVWPGA